MGDEALERRLVVEACEHIPVNAQQRVKIVVDRPDSGHHPPVGLLEEAFRRKDLFRDVQLLDFSEIEEPRSSSRCSGRQGGLE